MLKPFGAHLDPYKGCVHKYFHNLIQTLLGREYAICPSMDIIVVICFMCFMLNQDKLDADSLWTFGPI
jgi:hypothetical protein